jgi:hypothetical protein
MMCESCKLVRDHGGRCNLFNRKCLLRHKTKQPFILRQKALFGLWNLTLAKIDSLLEFHYYLLVVMELYADLWCVTSRHKQVRVNLLHISTKLTTHGFRVIGQVVILSLYCDLRCKRINRAYLPSYMRAGTINWKILPVFAWFRHLFFDKLQVYCFVTSYRRRDHIHQMEFMCFFAASIHI